MRYKSSNPFRRDLLVLLVSFVTALAGAAGDAVASSGGGSGQITFITGSSVYIDLGREDGLVEGTRLDVIRDGQVIGKLTIVYLSSHKASCSSSIPAENLLLEDGVVPIDLPVNRPILETDDRSDSADAEPRSTGRRNGFFRRNGIQGRVGLRYAGMNDLTGTSEDYSRPSLNLKAHGEQIAGSSWGIDLDLRALRTYRKLADGTSPVDSRTRVYRLSGNWNRTGSSLRMTAGRQVSPSLPSVSLFDGALVEYTGSRRSAGLFFGYQPDYETYLFSDKVVELGGYAGYRIPTIRQKRWSITGGAVASYEEGKINREYLFLQSRFSDRRSSVYASQQADLNRGWKREAGENPVSLTNTYVHGRHMIFEATTVEGGYDNRRNVRLYRYQVTPETEFDDSYRQGFWTGVEQKFGRHFRSGLRGRTQSGGIRSASLSNRLSWVKARDLRVQTRTTFYENQSTKGALNSVSVGFHLGPFNPIEITRGLRTEEHDIDPELDERLSWTGLDMSINMGRHWYMSVSGELNRGRNEENKAVYSGLYYRF